MVAREETCTNNSDKEANEKKTPFQKRNEKKRKQLLTKIEQTAYRTKKKKTDGEIREWENLAVTSL